MCGTCVAHVWHLCGPPGRGGRTSGGEEKLMEAIDSCKEKRFPSKRAHEMYSMIFDVLDVLDTSDVLDALDALDVLNHIKLS